MSKRKFGVPLTGSRVRIGTVSVVLAASLSAAAGAQTLRGVTVDAGERPVAGVVVMLVDSASKEAARALTNEKGEFRLTATTAGTYRLRTLRIGFRPTLSTPYALGVGSESTTRVVLPNLPVVLDTVLTATRSVCGTFDQAGAATLSVWEQIHAALTAAEITTASRTVETTKITYERTVDSTAQRAADRVRGRRFSVTTGLMSHAWNAVPLDILRQSGYVTQEEDRSINFHAPDLETLLSSGFVEDHCFRLASDSAANLIGIAFEPTSERRGIPEIQGTLWLDRPTSELRRLEFHYANLPFALLQENSSGELDFSRLRDGTWIISNWFIRMPLIAPGPHGSLSDLRVAGLVVSSGTVSLVRRESDTLWLHSPSAITGTVRDSISGAPIAGARITLVQGLEQTTSDTAGRFTIRNLPLGTYTLSINTESLDSMRAVRQIEVPVVEGSEPVDVSLPSAQLVAQSFCGSGFRNLNTGLIVGRVHLRSDPTFRLKGVHVTAEWNADTLDATRVRQMKARVSDDGTFRFCGVPPQTSLMLSAVADDAEMAEPTFIELPAAVRLAQTDLVLDRSMDLEARGATFVGIVIADSTHQPMSGAEVSLPEVGKSVTTGEHGDFRLTGIGPGNQHVVIRRIGFGPVDTTIKFTGHETIERRVILGRVPMLEAVFVSAKATEAGMAAFEEDRRRGFGHFLTRDDLDRFAGSSIDNLLRRIPGVDVIVGRYGENYVASKRVTGNLSGHMCFAKVYLDGFLMNPSGEPFDVNELSGTPVGAIEVFAGPETPLRYSALGSDCGTVVIWTRRGLE